MERMVAQSNLLIFLRLLTIIRFRLLFLFWLIHVSFKLCTRGSAKKVLSIFESAWSDLTHLCPFIG